MFVVFELHLIYSVLVDAIDQAWEISFCQGPNRASSCQPGPFLMIIFRSHESYNKTLCWIYSCIHLTNDCIYCRKAPLYVAFLAVKAQQRPYLPYSYLVTLLWNSLKANHCLKVAHGSLTPCNLTLHNTEVTLIPPVYCDREVRSGHFLDYLYRACTRDLRKRIAEMQWRSFTFFTFLELKLGWVFWRAGRGSVGCARVQKVAGLRPASPHLSPLARALTPSSLGNVTGGCPFAACLLSPTESKLREG